MWMKAPKGLYLFPLSDNGVAELSEPDHINGVTSFPKLQSYQWRSGAFRSPIISMA
jgi:hypothetical protein